MIYLGIFVLVFAIFIEGYAIYEAFSAAPESISGKPTLTITVLVNDDVSSSDSANELDAISLFDPQNKVGFDELNQIANKIASLRIESQPPSSETMSEFLDWFNAQPSTQTRGDRVGSRNRSTGIQMKLLRLGCIPRNVVNPLADTPGNTTYGDAIG